MDTLDPESHQIREVYARYGLALYQAQSVERELAILLATEYGPGTMEITRSQYSELLESHFANTLGSLIAHVRKTVSVPDDLEKLLLEALEKRNWLTHRYFWERAGHFVRQEGRHMMLCELQQAIDVFEELDSRLTRITQQWAQQHNVTQADMDAALARIIEDTQLAN